MKSYFTYFVFIFSLMLFGCKDEGTNIDGIAIPDSNISYQAHIQPIFDAKCNSSGCHDDATHQAGLSLTSWQKATSDFSIIFPGNPEASRLVLSIEGRSPYPMPPPGRYPLTQNQINAIRTWVKEGAKNN